MIRSVTHQPGTTQAMGNSLILTLSKDGLTSQLRIGDPSLTDSFLQILIGLQKAMLREEICEAAAKVLDHDKVEILRHMTARYLVDELPQQETPVVPASMLGDHLREALTHA